MADARLRVILEAQTQQLKSDFAGVKREVEGLGATLKSSFASAATAALGKTGLAASGLGTALAVAGGGLAGFGSLAMSAAKGVSQAARDFEALITAIETDPFVQTAMEFQKLEAQIKAFVGSSDRAKSVLAGLVEQAKSTPFELAGLVEADIQLRSFSQNVDRFLPVAESLAAVAGRSLPDAATALGKALAGIPEGVTQLQESFRVTRADLIQFGAEVDRNGTILSKTGNQSRKLADAIEAVSKAKFGAAIEERAKTLETKISNLRDGFTSLKNSLGTALTPFVEDFVGVLGAAIDSLGSFGQYVAGIEEVATAFEFVKGTAGDAAWAIQYLLSLLPKNDKAKNFDSTRKSLIEVGDEAGAARERVEELRLDLQAVNDFRIAKKEFGMGTKEVDDALAKLRQAGFEGNVWNTEEVNAFEAALRKVVEAKQKQKQATAAAQNADEAAGEAAIQAARNAETAIDEFYKDKQRQIYATKQAEEQAASAALKAADAQTQALEAAKAASKDPEFAKQAEAQLTKLRAAREKLEADIVDIQRDSLEKQVQQKQAAIDQELALGKISKAEAIKEEQKLTKFLQAEKILQLEAQKKRVTSGSTDAATLATEAAKITTINDQIKAVEKGNSDDILEHKRENAKDRLALDRELAQSAIDTAQAEAAARQVVVDQAKQELAIGGNVVAAQAKLEAAVRDRIQSEINALQAKAALEAQEKPDEKADIERRVQAEIKKLRGEEISQLREVAEEARQARAVEAQAALQVLEAETTLANARLSQAQRKFEKTGTGAEAVIAEQRAIQQLQEEKINKERDAALLTEKNIHNRVALTRKAEAEIQASRIQFGQQTEDTLKAQAVQTAEARVKVAELESQALDDKQAQVEEQRKLKGLVDDSILTAQQKHQLELEDLNLASEQLTARLSLLQAQKDAAVAAADEKDKKTAAAGFDIQISAALRDQHNILRQINTQYANGNSELDKRLRKLGLIKGALEAIRGRKEEAEFKREKGEVLSPEEEEQLKKDEEERRKLEALQRKNQEKAAAEARREEFKRKNQADDAKRREEQLRKAGKTDEEIAVQLKREGKVLPPNGPGTAPSASEESGLRKTRGPGPGTPQAPQVSPADTLLSQILAELRGQTALYRGAGSPLPWSADEAGRPHRPNM